MKYCRKLISILFFCVIFGFLIPEGIHAQVLKLSDNLPSFSVNNVSVTSALESLSLASGVKFSYNPDQLPQGKLIKIDERNIPLYRVLEKILGDASFNFKQSDNNIIIYRNKNVQPSDQNTSLQPVVNEAPAENEKTDLLQTAGNYPVKDTVIVYRNIHDTIRVTDVVIKTDTVFEKVMTPVSKSDIFHVNLGDEFSDQWKFDLSLNAGIFLPEVKYSSAENGYAGKVSEFKETFKQPVVSGSFGMELRASRQNITFAAGISYTSFRQKLAYNYVKQTGGFYRKDTLDGYYQIIDEEPVWVWLIDSTYVPVDNQLIDYNTNNTIRYFEVPLSVQLNIPVAQSLVFVKGGVVTGFFEGASGQYPAITAPGVVSIKEITIKKVTFSYLIAAGFAYPLSQKFTWNSSVFYRGHMHSIFKHYPIDTKFSAIGLSTGLVYKLY